MTNIKIKLPRIVGTRPGVAPFLVDVEETLEGEHVVLDCRALLSGTPSFADEMVKQILVERGAAELVVLSATSDFASDVIASARDSGIVDRIYLKEGGGDG
jgi:hypothetical protein